MKISFIFSILTIITGSFGFILENKSDKALLLIITMIFLSTYFILNEIEKINEKIDSIW